MANASTHRRSALRQVGRQLRRAEATIDTWLHGVAYLRLARPAAHRVTPRPRGSSSRATHAGSRVDEVADQLQRANQELLLHGELRRHFLAMASHELRTPLTAISGFAATMNHLWDVLPDAEKRKFVGIISEQAERLTNIVEDIFIVTRLEAGDYPIRPRQFDLRGPIDEALAALDAGDVVVDCPATLLAHTDPRCVRDMLVQMVGNAIKHGRPPIVVAARPADGAVEITVSDSGGGVPPEFVPYLFTKFTQVPNKVPDPTGTGLGLAVVGGLAAALGGTAWYEPRLPHGSTFGVRLPAPSNRRVGAANRRT